MNATNQSLIDERREKKRAYNKAYMIEYRKRNPEHNKTYKEANKEKIKATDKAYKAAHKEETQTYNKANRKIFRIAKWLNRGVKLRPNETWDDVYKLFIDTMNCQSCEVDFNESVHNTKKCLDHDHDEPNYTRGIICQRCNTRDKWRGYMSPNSIYQKYL